MKIILYSPVRQSAEILALALESHRALKGICERWYVDDNDSIESSTLLADESRLPGVRVFLAEHIENLPQRGRFVKLEGGTHVWTNPLMLRMSAIRDFGIQEFLKMRADALFTIDADMIAHPATVAYLSDLRKSEIVSEVSWARWAPGEIHLPNAWDMGNYGFPDPGNVVRMREPGLYPTFGFGANSLIHRKAFEAGVRYERVPGYEFAGEDRHIAIRASALGFQAWLDTHFPAFHVYRESELEEARAWWRAGCEPLYWREKYLDDDWAAAARKHWCVTAAPMSKTVACLMPGENFHSLWVSHWSTLLSEICKRYNIAMAWGYTSNVYATRNMLASCVIGPEADPKPDYVFWLDDDNLISLDAFNLLMHDLETHPEVDVVAGWTWIQADAGGACTLSAGRLDPTGEHCMPFKPSEFKAAADTHALIECEYTGFPCVLMRCSALDKAGKGAFGPIMMAGTTWGFSGEDVAWCIRARAAGVRIFVDPRAMAPHMKLRAVAPSEANEVSEVEETAMAAD